MSGVTDERQRLHTEYPKVYAEKPPTGYELVLAQMAEEDERDDPCRHDDAIEEMDHGTYVELWCPDCGEDVVKPTG